MVRNTVTRGPCEAPVGRGWARARGEAPSKHSINPSVTARTTRSLQMARRRCNETRHRRGRGVGSLAMLPVSSRDPIVGVAGHIDHGKTTLVHALTGVDTDRLPEEKRRGITIELGFAPLDLPNGRRASVIDMPGHERFVGTMISGAVGIDVMLLVVAADEGVMPQTREHLAVAELLGIGRCIVALSKADRAGDELVEMARDDVRALLAGGPFEDAPCFAVSALRGTGLDALRGALATLTATPRDPTGGVLLPIDRAFVRKGFGVVVTGTLAAGTVRVGASLAGGPIGDDARLWPCVVRAIQAHGQSLEFAEAGTRVALNLADVDLATVSRGQWIVDPARASLTRAWDAEVVLLAASSRVFPRRSRHQLALGTHQVTATVTQLDGDALTPGARALCRVTADHPVFVRPDERMVLRGPRSLSTLGSTVGGLRVLRTETERPRDRAIALDRAQRARHGDPLERALVALEAAQLRGLAPQRLEARTGFRAAAPPASITALGPQRWVATAALEALEKKLLSAISAFHGRAPSERGVEPRALVSVGDVDSVNIALQRLVARGAVVRDEGVYARAGWRPRRDEDDPLLPALRAHLQRAGLAAPSLSALAAELKVDAGAPLLNALKRLCDRGDVVRVNSELYVDRAALKALEAQVIAWFDAHDTLDAQGYKTLTGQSRKWAIAYAEYFDNARVTLRHGDLRRLRR